MHRRQFIAGTAASLLTLATTGALAASKDKVLRWNVRVKG